MTAASAAVRRPVAWVRRENWGDVPRRAHTPMWPAASRDAAKPSAYVGFIGLV